MKQRIGGWVRRWSFGSTLLAAMLAAGCSGGIGEGSTIQSISIEVAPVGILEQGALLDQGLPTERYQMYDCFCSTLLALATFTNGTLASFNYRATWTSSDPTVVEVMNGFESSELCPLTQQSPGMLVPKKPGTAVITAEFVGLTDSFPVEVVATDPGAFTVKTFDAENRGAVAVGGEIGLRVDALLAGRPRQVTGNVTTWSFTNPNDAVATISIGGTVRGVGRSGSTPLRAQAAFGTCPVTPQMDVSVGEIVAPMQIAREPGLAGDGRLAVDSDEVLRLTAALDLDGDGTGDGLDTDGDGTTDTPATQLVSGRALFDYTDTCTKRSYLAGGDGSTALTDCSETVATDCASTIPLCGSTQTACASGSSPCRTTLSPIFVALGNRIVARADTGSPTRMFATFPSNRGIPTTLAAAVSDTDTTLTVAALTNYPTLFPWEAVIDSADGALREIVKVTAVDERTLTVTRSATPHAHASGATFEQRTFGSTTTDIQATAGTLTSFILESEPTTMDVFGTLQLEAVGHFEGAVTRDQRVTHLQKFSESSPLVAWSSSKPSVASVSPVTGLVTSNSGCGGTTVIRARASSSANTVDSVFEVTTDTALDANDGKGHGANGNADTNDTACVDDPLCDQVTLTIPPVSNPAALGLDCD
jgi:hypothetical protein